MEIVNMTTEEFAEMKRQEREERRAQFAMHAMTGLIAHFGIEANPEAVAEKSSEFANALLKALEPAAESETKGG